MNRQEKLIAEIHAEFDTAQDRLLSQANAILSKPVDASLSAVESVGERLKRVGFGNTPTAKKSEKIKETKQVEAKKVVETREQAELIQYYQANYPFLKFLTEAELDRICKKYNLVYAPSERYIEEVPEKNLRDIETSQTLQSIDSPIAHTFFSGRVWCSSDHTKLYKTLKKECENLSNVKFEKYVDDNNYLTNNTSIAIGVLNSIGLDRGGIDRHIWIDGKVTEVKRDGLFIAAPQSHFNTEGLKKKGLGFFEIFETKITDPIVFRYVRGGIQVLTKWGLEANDPDLVVPKLN